MLLRNYSPFRAKILDDAVLLGPEKAVKLILNKGIQMCAYFPALF